MYDLECVEIWERSARIDQLQHCRTCISDRVRENSHSLTQRTMWVWAWVWVRTEDGEFCELWTSSHVS